MREKVYISGKCAVLLYVDEKINNTFKASASRLAQQKHQAATLISRLKSMIIKEINCFCDLLIEAVFELFSLNSLGSK